MHVMHCVQITITVALFFTIIAKGKNIFFGLYKAKLFFLKYCCRQKFI